MCRKCGSSELSETSGPIPYWLVFPKVLFGILILALFAELIQNLAFVLSLFVILGLLCLGLFLLPPVIKKPLQKVLKYLWMKVIGKRNKT